MTYGYDPHGRQNTAADARNGTNTYTFNNADQILTTTTPVPGGGPPAQVTTNHYNASLQHWKTTLPDNTEVNYEYYFTGLLKKTYGSRAYPVEYVYDVQGRMKEMKTWKDFGTPANFVLTTWGYHSQRGFLSNKRYDNGGGSGLGTDYTYKLSGRLWTRVWARGITTTYGYSNAGDMETVDYSDSTPDVTYTFDRRGRTVTAVRNGMTCTHEYNDAGQRLAELYSGGTLGGLSVSNHYDALLRRDNLTVSSNTTTYSYDLASRLQIVSNGNYSASYAYHANSPLVNTITFKQNTTTRMTTTKSYDFLNRLASISSVAGSATISSAYQHNSANQRTRATQADGSYWVYEYDSLGQVKSGKKYWSDGTPVAGMQFEYGFDDIGNRKTTKAGGSEWGHNLRLASYTANNLNQYTQRTVPGKVDVIGAASASSTVTYNNERAYRKAEYYRKEISLENSSGAVFQNISILGILQNGSNPDISTIKSGNVFLPQTPEAFSYDADGNLTNDGRWTYTWDGENRLIQMEGKSSIPSGAKLKLDFGYDYQGRRIEKIVSTLSGTNYVAQSTNKFLYDGWNLVSELNHTNGPVRSYAWGLDLSGTIQGAGGVGGLLMVKDDNNTHFTAYDGNGNVMALVKGTDSTASATYEYGPFGETLRIDGAIATSNPFRFSTKYTDDESDLLYYGYRYYSPSTGRWLNRDPMGERGGMNLYGFVNNNSIDWIDSDGKAPMSGGIGGPPLIPPGGFPEEPPITDIAGFALCRRNFVRDGTETFFEGLVVDGGNAVGGEHTYIQYQVCNTKCPKSGWGLSGGPPRKHPDQEKAFKPTSCKPCKRTSSTLKFGFGSGMKGTDASDFLIMDCIYNAPIKKAYSKNPSKWYVCSTWAKEAIQACGLQCK